MNKIEWKISKEVVQYMDATLFMEKRVAEIIDKKSNELVWCLEHPSLYTAGTSAKKEELFSNALPVFHTGRGGKYTYHGPGQRIIYLMLDLKRIFNKEPDLRAYIYMLEEVVIKTLEAFQIKGERRNNRVGIWVERDNKEFKIAAIGIRVRKWVSFHGIAVNIDPNLNFFDGILPCGIKEFGVTSLADCGVNCTIEEFDAIFKTKFNLVF